MSKKTDLPKKTRLELVAEFDLAAPETLFQQEHISAVCDFSNATLERNRWLGVGIPFVKMGRLVRYRKSDVLAWIAAQIATSHAA